MQARFLQFIKERKLFFKEDRLLLAFSGGVDSVVCGELLKRLGYFFSIAHCNFQLRGEQSDQDAQFARNWAVQHEVPFFVQTFATHEESKRTKRGIQETARDLRYAWFRELAKEEGFDRVIFAHHGDDQLETTLYRLVKGSSVRGLRSMRALEDIFARPLLPFTKEEVVTFAKDHELTWREDRSNDSDDYARNYIRHRISPVLKELNPSVVQTNLRTTARLEQLEFAWNGLSKEKRRDFVKEESTHWEIDKKVLELPYAALLLEEWLRPFSFSFDQLSSLSSETVVGSKLYAGSVSIHCERKVLRLNLAHEVSVSAMLLELDHSQTWGNISIRATKKTFNGSYLDAGLGFSMDFDSVRFPIHVRSWQEGDRFRPLGLMGSKKVSDFFTDVKLEASQKTKVPILCDQEGIIGILGYRIDERVKGSAATKQILEVRWEFV